MTQIMRADIAYVVKQNDAVIKLSLYEDDLVSSPSKSATNSASLCLRHKYPGNVLPILPSR
jgi:hypothetical protein